MADQVEIVSDILKEFLGDPKSEGTLDGWSQWNCPNCEGLDGVTSTNKYNLEVNILDEGGWCHCWKCEYAGRLSKLIKEFGGRDLLHRFIHEMQRFRAAQMYELGGAFGDEKKIFGDETLIKLPYGFTPLRRNDRYAWPAYQYLYNRGIGDDVIERFRIGYIAHHPKAERGMWNRIVIPSYDCGGDLNYWVSRDYGGYAKQKYKNPKLEKKYFIFNEGLVNWDEDITLVEGVFDHIAVPNSIPLLGKSLDGTYTLYNALMSRAKANVNILLDDDAIANAKKLYKMLYNTRLRDNVRLIECPAGYDAALLYQQFGKPMINRLMRTAKQLSEYELSTGIIYNLT